MRPTPRTWSLFYDEGTGDPRAGCLKCPPLWQPKGQRELRATGYAACVAATSAQAPRQANPATSTTFRALVSAVVIARLHRVQPFQRRAHLVQWDRLDGAQQPSQPRLVLNCRRVRRPG